MWFGPDGQMPGVGATRTMCQPGRRNLGTLSLSICDVFVRTFMAHEIQPVYVAETLLRRDMDLRNPDGFERGSGMKYEIVGGGGESERRPCTVDLLHNPAHVLRYSRQDTYTSELKFNCSCRMSYRPPSPNPLLMHNTLLFRFQPSHQTENRNCLQLGSGNDSATPAHVMHFDTGRQTHAKKSKQTPCYHASRNSSYERSIGSPWFCAISSLLFAMPAGSGAGAFGAPTGGPMLGATGLMGPWP